MEIIHWIGIDDHADKWTIAHLRGAAEKPSDEFELVPNDAGYRKLITFAKNLGGTVRFVYEAGPCGYDLYRRLNKAGLRCDVAAPSLTPHKPGQRVKTNRRDALKLARYLRAGELTLIHVPDPNRESLRDLVRARTAAQKDLLSVRHQISKLLLRHGHRYRDGRAWTQRFWTWLGKVRLEGEHAHYVLEELVGAHAERAERIDRYTEAIETAARKTEYAPYVAALSVLRGIDTVSAMTILAELGDLRRFSTAPELMAAIGLVPGEHSTGDKTVRLSITKGRQCARAQNCRGSSLALSAPTTGRPHAHAPAKRASEGTARHRRRCDLRLNKKFLRMTSRGKRSTVAAVAVARELMGFIWAIGQLIHP